MDRRRFTLAAGPLLALLAAQPAVAHGFGQRFDLPLPLTLWVWGAGLTIVLSFVVTAIFVRDHAGATDYPRFNLLRLGPFRWLAEPAVILVLRVFVAFIFVVTIIAGYFGAQDPFRNLIVPMIWVVWWVGFAFTCALVGNIWLLVNPLRTIFTGVETLFGALSGGRPLWLGVRYPRWLGYWPAVIFFLAFAWSELVWPDNDVPKFLARSMLSYSLITWIGMIVFGRDAWLEHADAFTVAFGVLGRFAPLEVRLKQAEIPVRALGADSTVVEHPFEAASPVNSYSTLAGARRADVEWNLRPPGAGLLNDDRVGWSFIVFVLAMLSTVTFDGFLETPLFQDVMNGIYTNQWAERLVFDISEFGIEDTILVKTSTLILFPLIFVGAFSLASWLMLRVTESWAEDMEKAGYRRSVTAVAGAFVLTLVPIAVAYHLAHYFSLLLTAGQFIIPLASDPLGLGWNLFGTADYQVNIGIVSPYFFWYAAVTAIVIGHVVAVYLSHVVALRVFGSRKAALVSQIPMVALMVGYTMVSLWILAQPIVGK